MEQATAARCPGCGFENNPFYRYCGMCGHPLRAGDPPLPPIPQQPVPPATDPAIYKHEPVPRAEAPVRETRRNAPPIAVNGFSILGLGHSEEGAAEQASDEQQAPPEPRTHDNGNSRRHEFGGALGLRDTETRLPSAHDIRYLLEDDEPRRPRTRKYLAWFLLAAAFGALIWHWQTNGYPWESAVRESSHKTTAGQDKPAPAAPPVAATAQEPAENTPKPTAAAPAPPDPAPDPVSAAGLPAARTDAPAAAPQPEAVPPGKRPAPPAHKSEAAPAEPRASARPAEVATNDPARLFSEGEKYLYGDGVPRDCDRAQKDLRTAAAHSYAQAESLLGTMYASGHCLGRDLPAAYRWYARALRHDQGNSRISSDLEVLWSQMTSAERKAAQSGGQ
jgi:outer membrane biosynthesis protein TonB